MMTPRDIKKLLERSPFIPLRLHLTNGNVFEIKHPDFVWIFRSRLEVAVPAPEEEGILDHTEHISLLHLVRIEELPVAA